MYTLKIKLLAILTCVVFLGNVQKTEAQKRKKKKEGKEVVDNKQATKKKKEKTIEELTKKSKKISGLFTVYQDTITGGLKMLVKHEQLNKDYIYFSQIADGISSIRAFRGNYKGSKLINIKKHFNKIEFIVPNTSFYFDENNLISKSASANITDANLASVKILATNKETNEYLIDINSLFLSETFTRITPQKRPGARQNKGGLGPKLGSLDKHKSKIITIKNYPENTNIKTEYVYGNSSINQKDVKDGKNISIKTFHTFMSMPEDNYQPRIDDPRVGYFATQVNDMTSTETVNYRDLIHRWKLVKKNPESVISEPVKPITWWIENSTPLEWRETITAGVLAWNKAFEKAGFKNALEVKIQPDSADWDAGDVRYNVLRWTSSPNPTFGGYGPSFVNPKTGEILGADIMLEYVHFTNRIKYDKIFTNAANHESEDKETFFEHEENSLLCSKGHLMHENSMFGKIVLASLGASDFEMKGMKEQAMKSLIMHEVGHTLGLNHNMKASQLFSPEQLATPELIKGKCLTGSVMDYAGINLTNDKNKQGLYFDMDIGPYDVWAIQFGYQVFNTEDEKNALLNQSTKPALIFGNDADDMRAPGKAIDPRVMVGDMSNDQITYSINRINLVNDMLKDIKLRFSNKGSSYEELRQAYYILNNQSAIAGGIISRFIGGVYVDRAMAGQEGETQPYTPVSYADQKRAMKALETYIFAPNAFKAPKEIYNYLAKQRRGYGFFSATEDPKIHQEILRYQNRILAHILHKNTLQRISDSELYGNQYKLATFMTDLNDAIFKTDINGSVNSFRQNLQTAYTRKLITILSGKGYTNTAKAMALYNLKNIKSMVSNASGDIATKAHKNVLKVLIKNTMEDIK